MIGINWWHEFWHRECAIRWPNSRNITGGSLLDQQIVLLPLLLGGGKACKTLQDTTKGLQCFGVTCTCTSFLATLIPTHLQTVLTGAPKLLHLMWHVKGGKLPKGIYSCDSCSVPFHIHVHCVPQAGHARCSGLILTFSWNYIVTF